LFGIHHSNLLPGKDKKVVRSKSLISNVEQGMLNDEVPMINQPLTSSPLKKNQKKTREA
jgi:hypothetical protein